MSAAKRKRTPQNRRLVIGVGKGKVNGFQFLMEADHLRETAPQLLGPATIDRLHLTYAAELLEAAGRRLEREAER